MSSTRETPKKLAAVLEPKNSSCSGDCCRLCRCLFRVQKGDKFQHISTENLFKIPGKKGVEKRPLHELLSEDLGLHLSSNPNYSSRVCAKCALKIRNAVELVRFLKANLNPVANIGETNNNITKFYPLRTPKKIIMNKQNTKNCPVILLAPLRCVLFKNKILRLRCL